MTVGLTLVTLALARYLDTHLMPCHLRHLFALLAIAGAVGCGVRMDATTAQDPSESGSSSPDETSPARNVAPLKVVHGTGELGDADYGDRRLCKFTVQNSSSKPLTLFVADKSCACAGVEINPATVPAQQMAEVVVHWSPKLEQGANEDVRVRTTIQAKEDAKINLSLEGRGRVRPALYVSLPRGELDFGRMDVADLKKGRELALEVYAQDARHENFTLHANVGHPGLSIVPSELPRLTKDRLEALHAVAGYRINIHCGDGMRVGRFRETIKLTSDAYPDRGLEVVVSGWVESGAVTVNPAQVSLPEVLPLGTGYKAPPIEITLRGEPDRSLQFVKAEPAFLQVQTEQIRPNTWRVKVSVPAGESELGKYVSEQELQQLLTYGFSDGCLVFSTTHSRLPTISVLVPGRRFQR